MNNRDVVERMRADWNERARQDAYYYVAFGGWEQNEEEFQATAADVVRSLDRELRRLPASARGRALEIGCGPARLLLPMSRYFAEIHGVDISEEMVQRARARLRDVPHAHVRVNDGAGLADFAGDSFDFVYSYAVFQHIPSREVVLTYLREAWRVLKPGGFLRAQINGLPPDSRLYDTWAGVRISAPELADFAREQSFQLLAIEGESTQYMWTTMRKRESGWQPRWPEGTPEAFVSVCRVTNAYSSEPAVPSRGRLAWVSLWLEGLPEECDLNHVSVTIAGQPARPAYIGPPEVDQLRQLNIALPQPIGTGLMPVEVRWLGRRLVPVTWVRVIPAGPAVPRLVAGSDGVELVSRRIVSRMVKITLEEVNHPEQLRAFVDAEPVEGLEYACTDPVPPRYEVNVPLPPSIGAGAHQVHLWIGRRKLAPIPIEVAQ